MPYVAYFSSPDTSPYVNHWGTRPMRLLLIASLILVSCGSVENSLGLAEEDKDESVNLDLIGSWESACDGGSQTEYKFDEDTLTIIESAFEDESCSEVNQEISKTYEYELGSAIKGKHAKELHLTIIEHTYLPQKVQWATTLNNLTPHPCQSGEVSFEAEKETSLIGCYEDDDLGFASVVGQDGDDLDIVPIVADDKADFDELSKQNTYEATRQK